MSTFSLAARFPTIDSGVINQAVDTTHHQFDGRPVRDFLRVLVSRLPVETRQVPQGLDIRDPAEPLVSVRHRRQRGGVEVSHPDGSTSVAATLPQRRRRPEVPERKRPGSLGERSRASRWSNSRCRYD
ncbi:three-helix bundle dimerization domain-containing protein [Rhodococcus opacus]|uniref:three-helix bundle dimerization domain-containing protein n=1 Tax=Rhodococcus opacus TaxID=37919 RepID=UPI0034E084D3